MMRREASDRSARARAVAGAVAVATLVALSLVAAPAAAGGHGDRAPAASGLGSETNRLLAEVRRATARYQDVDAATAAGFVDISGCVPQMGHHYARLTQIPDPDNAGEWLTVPSVTADQAGLDHTDPDLLVYVPRPNGSLRLVAVEYGSWAPASLFGTAFAPPAPEGSGGPPFHTLHAWVWQANPLGMFAPYNPNVSCG
jgi:hypothetical protein